MKKLTVIGIGPGSAEDMTYACRKALESADIIVGYQVYVALVKPLYPHKPTFETPMLREVERCREALRLADEGKVVAMVCSGDAGVYGMAGLVFQLQQDFPQVEVQVISGVTAALSGAAILGAPLTHDFAVISLSDLLTPWEMIEKRLKYSAMGDMSIVLYNPSSKKRKDFLQRACDIILEHQPKTLVCGLVRNIGREGESSELMTLEALRNKEVDMFTTVFIGNSQTQQLNGHMVTPRGYHL